MSTVAVGRYRYHLAPDPRRGCAGWRVLWRHDGDRITPVLAARGLAVAWLREGDPVGAFVALERLR